MIFIRHWKFWIIFFYGDLFGCTLAKKNDHFSLAGHFCWFGNQVMTGFGLRRSTRLNGTGYLYTYGIALQYLWQLLNCLWAWAI